MNKFLLTLQLSLIAVLAIAAQARGGDIVVIMGSQAEPLTQDQVAGIYLGRNNTLRPLDLPESSPLREEFYKKTTARDLAQIKAVWSRLVFTGQGHPPKEMADAAAVKKAVAADPRIVGYIDKADVDASVKVVLALK
jgi:hypothetical protein